MKLRAILTLNLILLLITSCMNRPVSFDEAEKIKLSGSSTSGRKAELESSG